MTPELKAAFRWHMQNPTKDWQESFEGNRVWQFPVGEHAKSALRKARKDVGAGKRRYPAPLKPCPAVSWQDDKRQLAYVENPANAGLRYVGRVEADTPRGNVWDNRETSGWYTDPYGDTFRDGTGLCYGVVYQLPARDGMARFVAGYQFGGVDGGPILDLGTIYEEPAAWWEPIRQEAHGTYGGYWNYQDNPLDMDAARDAASAADSMAQRAAEEEREYQTAWAAGSCYADESNDLQTIRAEVRGILQERRAAMHNPAVTDSGYFALCDAIRKRVADLLDDMHERRRVMRELASGDHDSLFFYPGDKRLQEAFCEGAGLDKFPA